MRSAAAAVLVALVLASRTPSASAAPVEREIAVGGATRSYLIHVPPEWDRASAIPVLFVFHGAGSRSEDVVEGAGFDALAARTPMLVVYPRALASEERYDVSPATGRVSADVEMVDAILARLRERFPVDPRRVFATGFSNGAAFCYRLAVDRPRVFAAIAPVAGYLLGPSDDGPGVPTPVLHVHGSADARVPAPSLGGDADSPVAAWARRNGATSGPVIDAMPSDGRLVVRRATWSGPTPRSDTRLLLVEGEDHVWPGGPAGTISRAILEFLTAHPRADETPAPTPGLGAFGSTATLRWQTPEGRPVSVADQPLTLFRWWTNQCPHCTGSVPALARLEERHRARGLRLVAVYHPKGARLSDDGAREYARGLGFSGALAFDDQWTKYYDLSARFHLDRATSISVLVDAHGTVVWAHPGPRIEEGSAALADLESVVNRLLPAEPSRDIAPTR